MKFIIKYLIHSLTLYLRLPIHYLYVIIYSIRKVCNYTLLYKNDESLSLSFNLMFHRSRERISSNSSLCTTSRIKKKAYTIPIHRPSSMKFTPPPLLKIIAIINHNDEFHRVRTTEFLCFPSWNLVPLSLICKCIPPVRY